MNKQNTETEIQNSCTQIEEEENKQLIKIECGLYCQCCGGKNKTKTANKMGIRCYVQGTNVG